MIKYILILLLIPNLVFSQIDYGILTPTLNEQIQEKNIIYSPTFEIAWTIFKDQIFQGNSIILKKRIPYLNSLNAYKYNNNDFKSLKHISVGGLITNQTADSLNKQSKKLDFNLNIDFLDHVDSYVVLSAISYKVGYLYEFETFNELPLVFDSVKVNSFGILRYYPSDSIDNGKQVKIYDYKDMNDFIIKIQLQDPNNELILAKIPPCKTLKMTYEQVIDRISKGNIDTLTYMDILQIPILDFALERTYTELIGNPFENKCCKGLSLDRAYQSVNFRMDEKGIEFESRADLEIFCITKHRLIFNKPFLVILKNKDSNKPFFASWINNTNCMEKSN